MTTDLTAWDKSLELALDPAKGNALWKMAQQLAGASLVPKHYRGKPEDVFLCLSLAVALGIPGPVALQQSYSIGGSIGFKVVVLLALAAQRGTFRGPVRWLVEGNPGDVLQGDGGDLAVTAYAVRADDPDGERVEATVTLTTAIRAGWTKRGWDYKHNRPSETPSPYEKEPEQMLRWRAAGRLLDLYAPELKLGVPTAEELRDLRAAGVLEDAPEGPRDVDIEGVRAGLNDAIRAAQEAPQEPAGEEQEPDAQEGGSEPERAEAASEPQEEPEDEPWPERPPQATEVDPKDLPY